MKTLTYLSILGGLAFSAAWIAGCGPEKAIEIRYERPAEYQISPQVRRVGIAEFGGQSSRDRQWSQIASDRLAAALDVYNRKYNRYELVDRKRLKAILDERDLQIAISDSASADTAGKLAKVDAMIYGSVKVTARDDRGTRTVFNPLSRSMKTVTYTKRYCLGAVNFTMDDVKTGKTLATVATTHEYDSEKDKKSGAAGIGRAMGFGGDDLPPTDQVISRLIDECVREFLSKVCPHEVVVTEKLQSGKSKIVSTGNKLAVAGDYEEALDCYQQALGQRPDDHGAAFNAGLMHEALGRGKKAEEFYDMAFRIKPSEKYVFARKRVRVEGAK